MVSGIQPRPVDNPYNHLNFDLDNPTCARYHPDMNPYSTRTEPGSTGESGLIRKGGPMNLRSIYTSLLEGALVMGITFLAFL